MKIKSNRTFIIAEIGPNHNGSFKRAIKMIKKLAKIDVDAIKFQLGDPEEIYSDDAFFANYQKKISKSLSIKKLSKKNQLSRFEHLKLSKLCKKEDLMYLCSAFDLESLKFLDRIINVPLFKIASGEAFALDAIDYVSKRNKPILISTGMTTFQELKIIIKKLNKNSKKKITILHCVSSYPAKINDLNLNIMNELEKRFKCNIGYSDHSLGDEACLAAVAKGAKVIEKHVTLSKKLSGPDHRSSSTISEFKNLVLKIRKLEQMLGKDKKIFSEKELNVKNSSRKSIVSNRLIKKNSKICLKDITFKRPGTGISPLNLNKVLRKVTKVEIPQNRLIKKSHLK